VNGPLERPMIRSAEDGMLLDCDDESDGIDDADMDGMEVGGGGEGRGIAAAATLGGACCAAANGGCICGC